MENNKKDKLAKLDKYTLYNISDLEPIFGVSYTTLLSLIKKGELKAAKIGDRWKISEENIKKYFEGINK